MSSTGVISGSFKETRGSGRLLKQISHFHCRKYPHSAVLTYWQYGYQYHFDIMAQSEVLGDNPVVNFEAVSCPSSVSSDYSQCQCA